MPRPTRPRLAVLLGSYREGRFGPTIGSWVVGHATAAGYGEVDLIDLADEPLPIPHPADARAAAPRLLGRLEAADALVIVFPEYNHSFPGVLKVALDLVGRELVDTPVGLVTYGGLSGGLRAAEALRPVLSTLGALAVRDTVSFANPWDRFEDGSLTVDADPAEQALDRMLGELDRFVQALRPAVEGRAAA